MTDTYTEKIRLDLRETVIAIAYNISLALNESKESFVDAFEETKKCNSSCPTPKPPRDDDNPPPEVNCTMMFNHTHY